ncbi:hypothetical protein BDV95DRAFT_573133 [Massariosphaeria phaeospora]|uniref:Uncharacterized protein n=1 Tax=Massariosphaeria phaeospora TaxID=100035 RepID=A0A7C8M932_9PLEO|nr:hypothetical protein BDV95DRAFT_573133 [Massariosphaeria phaeospora]
MGFEPLKGVGPGGLFFSLWSVQFPNLVLRVCAMRAMVFAGKYQRYVNVLYVCMCLCVALHITRATHCLAPQ